MTLLSPALMARLEALTLQSRHRLVGRFGGEHRSRRYGTTLDFADFREYHPGDDFRNIDYHVLARLDQVLIKLYEAEDEVTVRLLIDTSASMQVEGKLETSKRLAAAVGFVALSGHDAVTVHTFPASGIPPRFVGRPAVGPFLAHLEHLQPSGPTPFAQAAGHLLGRTGLPGITIVISDLLTKEWESLMRLRASGSDLIVFHVLAHEDVAPEFAGDLELVDREIGERMTVSVTEDIAEAFRKRVDQWVEDVRSLTRAVGGVYVPVAATAEIEALLLSMWHDAGLLR